MRSGRYGRLWRPGSEAEAMQQIYATKDPESFERGGRQDFEWLSAHFGPESTVLDLGCGIGRVASHVAPACGRLVAVDASRAMLKMARRRLQGNTNVTYVRCRDVVFPEVPSASVDLAYSVLVLQHVEREDAFLLLEELRRVVRSSGTVVVTFPNLLSDVYLRTFVGYAHDGDSTKRDRARMYTPQEVERILPAAGFDAQLTADTEIRVVARPV